MIPEPTSYPCVPFQEVTKQHILTALEEDSDDDVPQRVSAQPAASRRPELPILSPLSLAAEKPASSAAPSNRPPSPRWDASPAPSCISVTERPALARPTPPTSPPHIPGRPAAPALARRDPCCPNSRRRTSPAPTHIASATHIACADPHRAPQLAPGQSQGCGRHAAQRLVAAPARARARVRPAAAAVSAALGGRG